MDQFWSQNQDWETDYCWLGIKQFLNTKPGEMILETIKNRLKTVNGGRGYPVIDN